MAARTSGQKKGTANKWRLDRAVIRDSVERLDERYSQLAHNFAVDALTAEVAGTFGREGIETLVLKGPVLAKWLYPDEVRTCADSDLMIESKKIDKICHPLAAPRQYSPPTNARCPSA
jgi:hypothetical protein